MLKKPIPKNDPNLLNIEILKDWVYRLCLDDLDIIIQFIGTKYIHERVKASSIYNTDLEKWVLYFGENTTKFQLIHELGHIFLAKLTKKMDYCKLEKNGIKYDIKEVKRTPIEQIINVVEDAFVNYNLIEYKNFYNEFMKLYPKNGIFDINNENIQKSTFFTHINQYIYYYLHLNSVMKTLEKKQRKHTTNYNLKTLKVIAIEKAKKEGIMFNETKFIVLNEILDSFNKIKNTKDFMTILRFAYKIIIHLNIILKPELLKEIQKKYQMI